MVMTGQPRLHISPGVLHVNRGRVVVEGTETQIFAFQSHIIGV